MFVKTFGSAVYGVNAYTITIEVNVSGDGASYALVGLPDNAVKESWLRIATAFKNNQLNIPRKKLWSTWRPLILKKKEVHTI